MHYLRPILKRRFWGQAALRLGLMFLLGWDVGSAQVIFEPEMYSLYSDTSFHSIVCLRKVAGKQWNRWYRWEKKNNNFAQTAQTGNFGNGQRVRTSFVLDGVEQLGRGKRYAYSCKQAWENKDSLVSYKVFDSYIDYDEHGLLTKTFVVFNSQDTVQEHWFQFDSLGMLVDHSYRDCNGCGLVQVSMSYEYDSKNRLLEKKITPHLFGALNSSILVYYHEGMLGRNCYQVMYEFGGRNPSESGEANKARIRLPPRYRFVKEDTGADRIMAYLRTTEDRAGRLKSARYFELGVQKKLRIRY